MQPIVAVAQTPLRGGKVAGGQEVGGLLLAEEVKEEESNLINLKARGGYQSKVLTGAANDRFSNVQIRAIGYNNIKKLR